MSYYFLIKKYSILFKLFHYLWLGLTAGSVGSSLKSGFVDAERGEKSLSVLVAGLVPLSCESHFFDFVKF